MRDQCAAAGIELVAPAAPQRGLARYAGFDLVPGSAPAELTREVAGPRVVIGSNSTALLNLTAVHATPAIRVTAPELRPLETALDAAPAHPARRVPPAGCAVDDLAGELRRQLDAH